MALFEAGVEVRLRGLQSRPWLNGQRARLIHPVYPDQVAANAEARVAVAVGDARMSVRPECVETSQGNTLQAVLNAIGALARSDDPAMRQIAASAGRGRLEEAMDQSAAWTRTQTADCAGR
jgi:hypothetical protein